MRAEDFKNQFTNGDKRSQILEELAQYCSDNNLDYSQTDKSFKITLPKLKEVQMDSHNEALRTRRKFNIDDWGPRGVDEGDLPDELPPAEYTLDEGNPPEGDDEA